MYNTAIPETNNLDMRQVFPRLRDFNLGIVIVAAHVFLDIGAIQSLFGPVVRMLMLPKIVPFAAIGYAIYLILSGKAVLGGTLTRQLFILVFFTICYTLMATIHPAGTGGMPEQVKLLLQYLADYIILTASIKTPRQLVLFLDIFLLALYHTSFHAIKQKGLIWFDTFLGDENEISVLMVIGFSLGFQFFLQKWHIIKKIAYIMVLINFATLIVVANSRGGVVSWAISLFCCWLFIKQKVRVLLIFTIVVIVILKLAPPKFFDEMKSLEEGTEETTAFDRTYGWTLGMQMFSDHPILGVGPANYPEYYVPYNLKYREIAKKKPDRNPFIKRAAHSTPVQWLAETGIIGAVILLMLLYSLFKNWRESIRLVKELGSKENDIVLLTSLAHGVAIAIVGYWIGSIFISIFVHPFFWILLPLSQIVLNMISSRHTAHMVQVDEATLSG